MTKLEQIVNNRAWRGVKVRSARVDGRPVYLLRHPSGATATIYKEPGDMDSRKWAAWAWKQACARRGA